MTSAVLLGRPGGWPSSPPPATIEPSFTAERRPPICFLWRGGGESSRHSSHRPPSRPHGHPRLLLCDPTPQGLVVHVPLKARQVSPYLKRAEGGGRGTGGGGANEAGWGGAAESKMKATWSWTMVLARSTEPYLRVSTAQEGKSRLDDDTVQSYFNAHVSAAVL